VRLSAVIGRINATLPEGVQAKRRSVDRWAHAWIPTAYQRPPGKGGIWYVRDAAAAEKAIRRYLTGEET
jgi:hypothetical protein